MMVPQTKVFIGSLPQGSRPEELRKLFERFGDVTECDIMNRCGFVHMSTEEQATEAIRELHNTTFNGAVITVERGRIKERGQRGPAPPVGGGARGGGGGRGGRGGGPIRGGATSRSAPYGRERTLRPMARNGGYDSRGPGSFDGYGVEDRRGFALSRDHFTNPPMFDRRGYGAPDDVGGMYPPDHRPMYQGDMHERRAPMSRGYNRAPMRSPIVNGDMYNKRAPPMRGGPDSGYRDAYAPPYAPMPRTGGGTPRGARDGGMRRF